MFYYFFKCTNALALSDKENHKTTCKLKTADTCFSLWPALVMSWIDQRAESLTRTSVLLMSQLSAHLRNPSASVVDKTQERQTQAAQFEQIKRKREEVRME